MTRVDLNQPKKRNNARLMLTTATGAALGMASRYVVPTKAEFNSMKNSADTFFSNAATTARGANRSMLKYGGIGAIAAAGIYLASKIFSKDSKQAKQENQGDTFEFSKYQALIDAPEYACELLLYTE